MTPAPGALVSAPVLQPKPKGERKEVRVIKAIDVQLLQQLLQSC